MSELTDARRRMHAALIAVNQRLDVPYEDDPRWTPWTRFVRPAMDALDLRIDETEAEVAVLRRQLDAVRARASYRSEAHDETWRRAWNAANAQILAALSSVDSETTP